MFPNAPPPLSMDNNDNANVLNMTYGKYPFNAKLKNMTTNVNKGVLVITP